MSQFLAALHALIADPQVVSALVTAILGAIGVAVFTPNGVASDGLRSLGSALASKAQRALPSQAYSVLKTLAEDACRYAAQYGHAEGLDNPAKAEAAVAHLRDLVTAHLSEVPGLKHFLDDPILRAVIEQAYGEIKSQLPGFFGLPEPHPLPGVPALAAVSTDPTDTPADQPADQPASDAPAAPVEDAAPAPVA